jgi:uncharacterized damage-inducible protein DinB
MSAIAALRGFKAEAHARTLRVAEALPPERLMWAPTPRALTLGQLLRHLHRTERNRLALFTGAMDLAAYRRARQGDTDLKTHLGDVTALEPEVLALRDAHAGWLGALDGLREDALAEPVPWFSGPMPRLTFLLALVEHEAHHRGQMVTYLRLLGVAGGAPWGG